eukprot:Rhum_TRINITY_DN12455_c0_g1::Rhum_TRINITY_DN12455_c0_g1_i1::g.51998::m.51998
MRRCAPRHFSHVPSWARHAPPLPRNPSSVPLSDWTDCESAHHLWTWWHATPRGTDPYAPGGTAPLPRAERSGHEDGKRRGSDGLLCPTLHPRLRAFLAEADRLQRAGAALHKRSFNTLLSVAARLPDARGAQFLFDAMADGRLWGVVVPRGPWEYASVMNAYAAEGNAACVRRLWLEMEQAGVAATDATYNVAAKAFLVAGDERGALDVWADLKGAAGAFASASPLTAAATMLALRSEAAVHRFAAELPEELRRAPAVLRARVAALCTLRAGRDVVAAAASAARAEGAVLDGAAGKAYVAYLCECGDVEGVAAVCREAADGSGAVRLTAQQLWRVVLDPVATPLSAEGLAALRRLLREHPGGGEAWGVGEGGVGRGSPLTWTMVALRRDKEEEEEEAEEVAEEHSSSAPPPAARRRPREQRSVPCRPTLPKQFAYLA